MVLSGGPASDIPVSEAGVASAKLSFSASSFCLLIVFAFLILASADVFQTTTTYPYLLSDKNPAPQKQSPKREIKKFAIIYTILFTGLFTGIYTGLLIDVLLYLFSFAFLIDKKPSLWSIARHGKRYQTHIVSKSRGLEKSGS
jgi:hypothetical protein